MTEIKTTYEIYSGNKTIYYYIFYVNDKNIFKVSCYPNTCSGIANRLTLKEMNQHLTNRKAWKQFKGTPKSLKQYKQAEDCIKQYLKNLK